MLADGADHGPELKKRSKKKQTRNRKRTGECRQKDTAYSFTYNQGMMAGLKKALDGLRSEHSRKPARDNDCVAIATVERLLVVHSQPFDVKNFYTKRKVRDEIVAFLSRGALPLFREWFQQWFFRSDDLYNILQHTFGSVANGTYGEPMPDEHAPVVQCLESEMQGWNIIDDDEVALGVVVHEDDWTMVHQAQWDDEVVAVKSRRLCDWLVDEEEEALACFIREAAVHASLAHPHVVRLYGVTPSCKLIMELADGNLQQMCQGRTMEWRTKRSLLQQASAALTHLHTAQDPVVHGLVSSLNFVTFGTDPDSCAVKLAGFGCAAAGPYAKERLFRISITSSVWMCPENFVTLKSDVFSFGVVAYEVVSGKMPYDGRVCSLQSLKTDRWQEPCPVRPIDCPTGLHMLMKRCCSADPSDRPTMEEVNQCLVELPKGWSQEVDTEAIAKRVCKSLRRSRGHMVHVRYNHNLMKFLARQLRKAKTIGHCMPCKPAAAGAAQEWRVSWCELDDAVRTGCSLIRRHSKDFDLHKFYTVEEAQVGVTRVCEQLRAVAVKWNLCTEIECSVPNAAVAEDDRFLHSFLVFLFEEGNNGQLPQKANPKVWLRVKKRLATRLSRLKMVKEDDIDIGHPIEGSRSVVCRARWNGIDVAVKRLRLRGVPDLNPQEFAKFYREACIQASVPHPCIAKLLAVSKSGLMVMELACCSLEMLYKEAHLDWRTKYRFLLQVAGALDFMHSREPPVVHCDVKSPNILIFGDKTKLQNCTAKLSDFGISVKETSTVSVTVRCPGGTPHWMAPEMYDEVHPSLAADVFGFGVVMYEVMSQTPPYGGRGTPNASIYHMKCDGQPPCRLPNDCPHILRDIMERCCSVHPDSRPVIRAVKEVLNKVLRRQSRLLPYHAVSRGNSKRASIQSRPVPSRPHWR